MIAIRVVSHGGQTPASPMAATFGAGGGDIGRGADCTLVLPDPERRISRKQARIACHEGRHFIRRTSPHSPVELDGEPLPLEGDYPLEAGARIRIGAYLLQADSALADDVLESAFASTRGSVFTDLLDSEPAVAMPRPAEIDVVVGEPAPGDAAAADALFAALYAGLGLPPPDAARRTPQQMQLVGVLLRGALDGTLGLLSARAIAKRELGADATQLQTRENNPLKFSPDAEAALTHLLGPAQRGFLAPQTALRDAFDDLRAHELALLTGMRAALDAVLGRFDPQVLETRLAARGSWHNLVPAARKARMWERYGQEYAQILREIESEVDSLFGRAFLRAYEAQLARLRQAAE